METQREKRLVSFACWLASDCVLCVLCGPSADGRIGPFCSITFCSVGANGYGYAAPGRALGWGRWGRPTNLCRYNNTTIGFHSHSNSLRGFAMRCVFHCVFDWCSFLLFACDSNDFSYMRWIIFSIRSLLLSAMLSFKCEWYILMGLVAFTAVITACVSRL